MRTLLLAILLALPAHGATEIAVAEAMKRPASAALYPEAGAVVLLNETVVTLDARGRTTTTGHLLVKILQERSRATLSDQRIPYRGDTQRCVLLAARTHLPTGAVQVPEAGAIMEVSDPEAASAPSYSSARMKVVAFPAVDTGAVLELHYRVEPLPDARTQEPPPPFSGQVLFAGSEPILEGSLTLDVPAGVKLAYETFNGGPTPTLLRRRGRVAFTWVVRDQPQVVAEAGMVPFGDVVPRVVWSAAAGRKPLGRWLYQRFRNRGTDPAVRAQARALTAGCRGPEAKTERLALFVTKEIQHVPLPLGRCGYRPTPPRRVLANRYADARDKFALFQALMEAVGLHAQAVFVQVDRVRGSRLAWLGAYEDLLARVPLPSGVAYYNLCHDQARLGVLLPVNAGRPGLLVGPEGGRAITTPEVDERGQFLRSRWDAVLAPDGTLTGRVSLEFSGLFDPQIRSLLYGRNEEDRTVFFQSLADGLRKGGRMEDYRVSDLLDLTQAPVVSMAFRIPEFACAQGDMLIVNLPGLLPLGDPPLEPTLPTMRHPFLMPATFALEAELNLALPEGYRLAYHPQPGAVRQAPFTSSLACAATPGGVCLRRSVVWRGGVVEPGAYPALWQAIAQTKVPGNALLLLERDGPR